MKRNLFALALIASLSTAAMASGIGNTFNQPTAQGGKAEGGDAAAAAVGVGVGIGKANASSLSQGGNGVGTVRVDVAGDDVQSATPPVVAGNIPAVPTSCRLYLFGGGATRDGAASGSIPLANDETCLSIAKLNLMERAGGFTQAEKQLVVCKVEGMSELDTCQKLATK